MSDGSNDIMTSQRYKRGALQCDVCVVTFNSADTIGRLLNSVNAEPVSATVRILDNASSDGTLDAIRAAAMNLAVPICSIPERTNVGFPAGCNKLLHACEAPVVALVNPDVEFTPGALAALVQLVSSDATTGIAACRQMTRDGYPQSEPARNRPRLRRLLAGEAPRWLISPIRRRRQRVGGRLFTEHDVECMSGALMVFRRDVVEQVGYLDTSVFMYLEDIDFAARVRSAGYRIRYLGTTWVWHDSGMSARGLESRLFAYLPQVWLTYLRRYGWRYERLAARPVLFVVCILALFKRLGHAEAPRGEIVALWHTVSYRPSRDLVW